MQNKEYVEEEIDLRELFNILAKKKVFIFVFTFAITLLAIIYVNIKTPIYEAKALVEIGSYKIEKTANTIEEISLANTTELLKKVTTIFIDLEKNNKDKEYLITSIAVSKGTKNFIEITSEAKTNELAEKGIKKVVDYIQKEYSETLNDVKNKNQSEIKNITQSISNIENEKIVNLDKKIELHKQNIINLEEQMTFVMQTLKNLNNLDSSIAALKLMEKRDISNEMIINKSRLYDLLEAKESIINIDLNKLIERKKVIETLLLPHNIKNTQIVEKILVNDEPAKPKKSLIIVVAFVTGFILSIFLVFFMSFISNLKKEDDKK